MSKMTKNELSAYSIDLLGSTWNSTSLDIVKSIDSFDAASTTINFTKATLYFDNNIVTGISADTSTSITST